MPPKRVTLNTHCLFFLLLALLLLPLYTFSYGEIFIIFFGDAFKKKNGHFLADAVVAAIRRKGSMNVKLKMPRFWPSRVDGIAVGIFCAFFINLVHRINAVCDGQLQMRPFGRFKRPSKIAREGIGALWVRF